MIVDKIKAEKTNDVHEMLTEDVWHQSMESVNIVEITEISNKVGTANKEDVIDFKPPRLMEIIEVSNPKEAKTGLKIQFLHKEGEGTIHWLEGTIRQRITKLSMAIRLEYAENYFIVN